MLRQLRHPRMDPPYHKSGSICSWQRPVEAFDCQLFRLDADGLGGWVVADPAKWDTNKSSNSNTNTSHYHPSFLGPESTPLRGAGFPAQI